MVKSREAFVKEVFLGIETRGVQDVGVQGNDINSHHDGVRREMDRKESYGIEGII